MDFRWLVFGVGMTLVVYTSAMAGAEFSPKVDKGAMRSAKRNLMNIVDHLVSGEQEGVAKQVDKLSLYQFIPKNINLNALTGEARSRAEAFLKKNTEYESAVTGLKQAVQDKKQAAVFDNLTSVTQKCIDCHKDFALNRFPGLAETPENPYPPEISE